MRFALGAGRVMVRLVLLACLLPLAACTQGADLAPLPPAARTGFVLGPGDQVRVITFGEAELTGEFRVGSVGDIAVPLLGDVHAAGLTPDMLGQAIQRALQDRHIFREPSVSVEVVTYRPVFILGEVARPGQYSYQPGMTVLTAVAVAGGFTYRAVESYAAVTRSAPNGSGAQEGKVERSTLVQPGDVITIFERKF